MKKVERQAEGRKNWDVKRDRKGETERFREGERDKEKEREIKRWRLRERLWR